MKWKDSEGDTEARVEREDLDFDGEKFSLKNNSENNKLRPNLFKGNFSAILMIGGAAVVIIILLVLFFSGPSKTAQNSQLMSLESKVSRLENRMANLEKRVAQRAGASDQSNALTKLKEQLGRLETTIAGQMNMMAADLEKLKQQRAAVRLPEKAPTSEKAPVPAQGGQVQYHQVRAGENLYRIGLQYGLSVDQLRQLNNMKPGAVIKPGQKLRVSP